ncbi:MAG: hypothetical protein HY260_22420, partial [Chloroflexi bacterium]|nr:hypothetical protein [Chloroflexota bacterium]
LRIRLDVGESDSLYYDTRLLADSLSENELPVVFTTGTGGHTRAYWRSHTEDYFRFYLSALTIDRPESHRR